MNSLLLAAMLTAGTDAATTHYGLTHGLREANPIVRVIGVQEHPSRIYIYKAATTGALLWVSTNRAFSPKQKRIMRWSVVGANLAATLFNLSQIRK